MIIRAVKLTSRIDEVSERFFESGLASCAPSVLDFDASVIAILEKSILAHFAFLARHVQVRLRGIA